MSEAPITPRTMRRPAPPAEDEEAPIAPRTMRRPLAAEDLPQVADEEPVAPPAEPDPDGDEETAPAAVVAPIKGGWGEGQKQMDMGSSFAQALKLEPNVQIIKFLDDQPYANYRRHWVDRMTQQGPKKRAYTCLEVVGKTCPLCGIGDRPQSVSAFNVVVVGDEGSVLLKTFDVGVKLFNVLKAFAQDPKVGPLTKGYYAVSKTGKGNTAQTNFIPVKASNLDEDYGVTPPTAAELASVTKYDASIIDIPKKSDLDEVAAEVAEYE